MAKRKAVRTDQTYVPSGDNYSQRRVETVLAEEKVQERAIEAGSRNEPATGDTRLDETQRRLVAKSQDFVGTASRVAQEELTENLNEMRQLIPLRLEPDLALSTIQRAVAETVQTHTGDLELAYAEERRRLRDLRAFEEAHRLAPFSAIYKPDVLMFATTLVVVLLAEGVGNAFLFRELQDQGLFGGLLVALAVSAANILLGLGAGTLGLRLLIHVRPSLRLLGTTLTALFTTAALALHLALGDLREAVSHHANAQIDFLVILKPWRWFDYTSPAPFVLFVVGVAAFVFAVLKGRGGSWGIVTPYWGHDVHDRRYREAHAALLDAEDNLRDALANAYGSERAKLLDLHAEDGRRLIEVRRLVAEAQGVARTLQDSIKAELGRLHIWLRTYRDINRQVRTTPPPAYFADYPVFEEWQGRLDTGELSALLQDAEHILAANARDLAALQDLTVQEETATIKRLTGMVSTARASAETRIGEDDAAATRLRRA